MQSTKRFIWSGLLIAAGGAYGIWESANAYRTGTLVHVPHSPNLEWWAAGGMSLLGVLFGLLGIAAGLGWIKPKDGDPIA